jgi:hypothetical protein
LNGASFRKVLARSAEINAPSGGGKQKSDQNFDNFLKIGEIFQRLLLLIDCKKWLVLSYKKLKRIQDFFLPRKSRLKSLTAFCAGKTIEARDKIFTPNYLELKNNRGLHHIVS